MCLNVCNEVTGAQRFGSEVPDCAQPAGSNISSISKALLTYISLIVRRVFTSSQHWGTCKKALIRLCVSFQPVSLDAPAPLVSALPMCSLDLSGEVDGCVFKYPQVIGAKIMYFCNISGKMKYSGWLVSTLLWNVHAHKILHRTFDILPTFICYHITITSALNLLVPRACTSRAGWCLGHGAFRGEGEMKSQSLYEGLHKQHSNVWVLFILP